MSPNDIEMRPNDIELSRPVDFVSHPVDFGALVVPSVESRPIGVTHDKPSE